MRCPQKYKIRSSSSKQKIPHWKILEQPYISVYVSTDTFCVLTYILYVWTHTLGVSGAGGAAAAAGAHRERGWITSSRYKSEVPHQLLSSASLLLLQVVWMDKGCSRYVSSKTHMSSTGVLSRRLSFCRCFNSWRSGFLLSLLMSQLQNGQHLKVPIKAVRKDRSFHQSPEYNLKGTNAIALL